MHELHIHRRKRTRPTEEMVAWRKGRLADLGALDPSAADLIPSVHLEPGNRKTGLSSPDFGSIWVWNLPPVASCPGRSDWCMAHCYNADPREEVYPVAKWLENLRLIQDRPEEAALEVLRLIGGAPKPVAVRIHSSGDFYSVPYIAWWRRIMEESPKTRFWAYTRSWVLPALREALEEIRALSNVQLFASWDATMPKPPAGWRLSIISEGRPISTKSNLDCPEQYEGGPTCADCGYCIRSKVGNVIFHSH